MFEFTDSGLILVDVYVNGTKTFTSANIKNGTFSVNRYSSSAVAPEFGNVTAGELIFSIDTTTVTPNISKGDVITATLYLSDDPTVTKEVGDFIITNLTKGVDSLDVTCLDRMIELDGVADLRGVSYPITATNFINQVFGTGLGFTVNIDSGVYGAVSLHQPYFEEKTTYRQVLSKVCECMGANAWYTDRLNIGWYKDTEEEIDETTYIDCDLAETGYPISVEVTPDISALPVEITDTGIVLRVVNNPFMVAASIQEWEANAQAIMQNIGNVTFYGASFTVLPMPELKPMDIVTIDNKLVPITSVTYGINENTKVESRVDEGDNLYNYDFSRQIEIAKETAKEAEDKVDDLNAYFWHDNLGAHVSDTPSSTASKNVLIDSDSVDIKDGETTLASFGEEIVLGDTVNQQTRIGVSSIEMEAGLFPPPYSEEATIGASLKSSMNGYDLSSSLKLGAVTETVTSRMTQRGLVDIAAQKYFLDNGGGIPSDTITFYSQFGGTTERNNWSKRVLDLDNGFVLSAKFGSADEWHDNFKVGWSGKITSALREGHNFGGTTVNFGEQYTGQVSFWGNTVNKVGIAVTNTQDSKQYAILGRSDHFAMYDYTSNAEVFRIAPPQLLYNGSNWGNSSVSITSRTANTWTSAGGITLEAGTYLIIGTASWSTNATGQRKITLGLTAGSSPNWGYAYNDFRDATTGDSTTNRVVCTVYLAEQRTIYMNVWQNSGSTLTIYPRASIFKLA